MRPLLSLYAVCALTLLACGESPPPPAASAPGTPAVQAPKGGVAAAVDTLPLRGLRRSAVREAIARGPGAFLQSVVVDEQPVFLAGKFHGFRIAELHGDSWRGVDLRPGDVVTRVNGFAIEHPEEALEAFHSLDVASELRVDYEREGVPRELRFPIVDDVPAQPASPPRTTGLPRSLVETETRARTADR